MMIEPPRDYAPDVDERPARPLSSAEWWQTGFWVVTFFLGVAVAEIVHCRGLLP